METIKKVGMEKLLFDKQETEKTIQELHQQADKLEEIEEFFLSGVAREKTTQFIKEVENEIEFNEQILDEINSSIQFEETRDKK